MSDDDQPESPARSLQRIEKIAKRTGLSPASLRRGIERRTMRGVRVGKIYLMPDDEPERLLQLADANLLMPALPLTPDAAAAAGNPAPADDQTTSRQQREIPCRTRSRRSGS